MKITTILRRAKPAFAIAAAVALSAWQPARAAGIPIANASFEMPAVRPGVVRPGGMPGWIGLDPSVNPSVIGVANLPAPSFVPPSDGSQVGFTFGGHGAVQVLAATLMPNTVYTLIADFYGMKPQVGQGSLALLAMNCTPSSPPGCVMSGTVLAYETTDGPGSTLQFQTGPGATAQSGTPVAVFFGQHIAIDIGSSSLDGRDLVFFDNIRMDASPLPTLLPVLHGAFCCGGISPQETARLNAYCDGSVMPVPCNATLEFHDEHGVLLKQADLNLRPGETGFLDFVAPADGDRPQPMEVIPRWFLTQGSATFSAEVFDTDDLRTRLFVNWGDGSVAKTGNLDSGPAAMTRGDTGRLKVYCDGSVRVEGTLRVESCQANLAFHDVNDRVLKQSHMTLGPGTAGFLDLTFEETRSMDRRVDIVPSLTVTGGPAVGSFALLDSASGRTITQSYPAAQQSVVR